MSAIAALCALSCAVMPVAAEQSSVQNDLPSSSQVAQIPVEVKPSASATGQLVPLITETGLVMKSLEPMVRQRPPQLEKMLLEMRSPNPLQRKFSNDAQESDIQTSDIRHQGLSERFTPDSTRFAAQRIPVQVAQIPVEVEPQAVDLDPNLNYSKVQIQDRSGDQQEFSLDQTPVEKLPAAAEKDPTVKDPTVLEVTSDRQEYNEQTKIVTAYGNVIARFNDGVLSSDRLQINLNSKLAIANGNVSLRRGQQLLRGEQFNYFFVQNRGSIQQAEGQVDQSVFAQDLSPQPASAFGNTTNPAVLLNERLLLNQPISGVSGSRGINISVGTSRDQNNLSSNIGTIDHLRFRAAAMEFVGDHWEAKNVYLTNDPFSPPELQVFAKTATYQSLEDGTSELVTTNTHLLIDNNISLPIYPRTFRFGESHGAGGLFAFGFDSDERGGLFIQRPFSVFNNSKGQWTITPQYLVQKALFPDSALGGNNNKDEGGSLLAPDVLAAKTQFNYTFSPRSSLRARGSLTTFDLNKLEDRLKLNVTAEQLFGNLANPFRLSQEFNYRDRLFNGSLGFQDVQRSFGVILRSPLYQLGHGFSLDYQGSIQNINANTDRPELLKPGIGVGLVSLTRLQGSVGLNYGLPLWSGKALPATRLEGLRYTPQPVVPYLSMYSGLRGVAGEYSNGDRQLIVNGTIGLQGQIGHFSRNSFDYTGFNLSYSRGSRGTTSPFLFDRFADSQTMGFGLTQQIYGPFRLGFQTFVNLDTHQAISTDYILEYSRRTHSIVLRYNPVLQISSVNIAINDFNWNGSSDPFVTQDIRSVETGVIP